MIEFLLSLLLALLTGTATISQASSITSDNPAPQITTYVEWPGYYLQWGNR
jgi:hypothetical protein